MKQQLKDLKTLLLLGSCLLLAACTGRTSKASGSEEAKPVITVTIEPQRYFTEAIAGDKFTVVSMVPKGSSPETALCLTKSRAFLDFSLLPNSLHVFYGN